MDKNPEEDFVMQIREIENEYILIIENKIREKFQTIGEAFKFWLN
ncbi:hypothetical protein SAMN05216324_11610 [Chryseobacterium limigenitum]|uniref:Uncharacterized protein n=1 Tax=Chryseobacterium limigenitum TaxID=1612149 RepID=A0A1K2IUJ4_9FLAO|nr:hypothetical protein SAMN05216324_11610 [Chryseobacterium limigenitum]